MICIKSEWQYELAARLIDKMILPNMFDLKEAECKAIGRAVNRPSRRYSDRRVIEVQNSRRRDSRNSQMTAGRYILCRSGMSYPTGKLPGHIGNERIALLTIYPDTATPEQWDEFWKNTKKHYEVTK